MPERPKARLAREWDSMEKFIINLNRAKSSVSAAQGKLDDLNNALALVAALNTSSTAGEITAAQTAISGNVLVLQAITNIGKVINDHTGMVNGIRINMANLNTEVSNNSDYTAEAKAEFEAAKTNEA